MFWQRSSHMNPDGCNTLIQFTRQILQGNNIASHIIASPYSNLSSLDGGLRAQLCPDDFSPIILKTLSDSKPQTIYHITDYYHCGYSFFRLPDTSPSYLFIGPYTFESIDHARFQSLVEQLQLPDSALSFLRDYYNNVPLIYPVNSFLVLLIELGNFIWGNEQFSVEYPEEDLWKASGQMNYSLTGNRHGSFELMEKRYELEDQLLLAVSQGNTEKAELVSSQLFSMKINPREKDLLRDGKTHMIVFNTLLRKAAEHGSVHPMHVDEISGKYARRIERMTSVAQISSLCREMIHNYCLLVKNHSLKSYSLTVQKAINYIDYDISVDLNLRTISSHLNLNASYLSSLFKRETNCTITDYISQKRIEHARFLLNSTTMQIQNIAMLCGISDLNYFTKLFKKFTGMTPSKYRGLIHRQN